VSIGPSITQQKIEEFIKQLVGDQPAHVLYKTVRNALISRELKDDVVCPILTENKLENCTQFYKVVIDVFLQKYSTEDLTRYIEQLNHNI
jgi:hypothetical protein